jgi:hypothetical protein
MRNTLCSFFVGVAAVALMACGGKILDDSSHRPRGDGSIVFAETPPAASQQQASPSPSLSADLPPAPVPPGRAGVADACAAVCKRNAQCGAWQVDCEATCAEDIGGSSACAGEGNAYVHCYADNLVEGCAALPPVCELAYCAYTRCAGKVVPSYCQPR